MEIPLEIRQMNNSRWRRRYIEAEKPLSFKLMYITERLFIPDNIDFSIYRNNETAYNSILKKCEDGDVIDTLSIVFMNCSLSLKILLQGPVNLERRTLPTWFFIGYPDVLLWMGSNMNLINDCNDELDEKLAAVTSQDSEERILVLIRFLVDKYKQHANMPLELGIR